MRWVSKMCNPSVHLAQSGEQDTGELTIVGSALHAWSPSPQLCQSEWPFSWPQLHSKLVDMTAATQQSGRQHRSYTAGKCAALSSRNFATVRLSTKAAQHTIRGDGKQAGCCLFQHTPLA